jgi:hypothetical protein
MNKSFFWFFLAMTSLGSAQAQNNLVVLQCKQIGEEANKVYLEIDFGNRKISVDDHLSRERWERLNQKKFLLYRKAVQEKDELGMKWWAPSPYKPSEYSIDTVTDSEVTANPGVPVKGELKIHRKSLVAYLYEGFGGAINESSYRCEKVEKGF